MLHSTTVRARIRVLISRCQTQLKGSEDRENCGVGLCWVVVSPTTIAKLLEGDFSLGLGLSTLQAREGDTEAQHELVKLIVERIYVNDERIVATTLRSNYHIVLGHNVNGPTQVEIDQFLYADGSDELRSRMDIVLLFYFPRSGRGGKSIVFLTEPKYGKKCQCVGLPHSFLVVIAQCCVDCTATIATRLNASRSANLAHQPSD